MRFKYNPWVSMVAALLLAVILALACAGCTTNTKAAAPSRFTAEYVGSADSATKIYIITDTETGVQYLLADLPNGIGLTKLEG